ncbi:hypothetical protein GETHLI_29230 [Geothrix limicola]|uniref:Collagen-like protein n=1 Tax=Geothrix limicola TaxID=2927978 RepID=A0ABQ5QJ61_9BACT|nr:hypothetical protein [Geothrix limicola]GLH74421.1 hypothetical protein GETHLI_29230 [Geothrix limicola]
MRPSTLVPQRPGPSLRRGAPCLLAFLLASTGCTAIRVWTGARVRLEKTPITSLELSLPRGPGLAPGDRSPLVVSCLQPDGTILRTEGEGRGKVLWEDLHITASVAQVDAKGIVSLPADPRLSDGRLPHLVVTVPSHPDLRAELDIPLSYDRAYEADFSGRPGRSGMDGSNGLDGHSGSTGSIDPANPSPGGNGSDGDDGASGEDGGPGEDAPPLHVQVALRVEPRPLLQISVSSPSRIERFLLDPRGGSLTLRAEGGRGGSGGRGGRGGSGGFGGTGTPSGSSGRSGMNGRDGFDGPSGRAGIITVTYDPAAKPYLGALRFFTWNGDRSSGPLPVFREEPTPRLW